MSKKTYAWFLRNASVEEGAASLRALGLRGLVLPGNEGWCTLVLPRGDRERAQLADLAKGHPKGVVDTGVVTLAGPVDGLADGFQARCQAGSTAPQLIAWLLEQEAVDEVCLSDEGMQRALDATATA